MKDETAMDNLMRALARKGASTDLIEALVTLLETDMNFTKMQEELSKLKNPSDGCLLGKVLLIADEE